MSSFPSIGLPVWVSYHCSDGTDGHKHVITVQCVVANIIVEKAGGNPLFIKELIGSGTLNENALPDSIYDVVMIKLDRLERAKRSALRKAAVIGQVFDLNILASITRDS